MTADTRLCSDRARVHLTSQSHQPETIPVKKISKRSSEKIFERTQAPSLPKYF